MIPSKRGIELSVNFLVALVLAVVVFGMGLYIAAMIFGGGGSIAEKKFEDFDRQVGELSCYAADSVCVQVKSETVNRGSFKALGVTIKNVFPKKQFKLVVQNTRFIDQAGDAKLDFDPKLMLFGLDTDGRIETLEKGEKKTFGVGVQVPKNAPSGQYTLNVMVYYADPEEVPDATTWEQYIERPYKIFVNVP